MIEEWRIPEIYCINKETLEGHCLNKEDMLTDASRFNIILSIDKKSFKADWVNVEEVKEFLMNKEVTFTIIDLEIIKET